MKRIWLAMLTVALLVVFAGVSPASAAQTQVQGTYTATFTAAGWQQVRDGSGNLVWCPSTVTMVGTLQEPYLGTGTFTMSFGICAAPSPGSFNLTTPQGTIAPHDATFVDQNGTTQVVTQKVGSGPGAGGKYYAYTGAPCMAPLGGTGRFANIVGSSYHYDPTVPPNPAYGYCVPGSYLQFDIGGAFAPLTTHTGGEQIVYSSAVTGTIVTPDTPTTKNDCKKDGWRHLFDTAGKPFKNQGDCVSFVATGGKNAAKG